MSRIQILDGGLGTSLSDKYAVHFTHTNPLWSSHLLVSPTDHDTLLACQRDFAETAGVDVLQTATYQVSIAGFAGTKTDPGHPDGIPREAMAPYLRIAVAIAERANARGRAGLALSLGPYGATMVPGQEYSGAYDGAHASEEALYEWHVERLRLFGAAVEGLAARVRYVAFETVPRVDEVRAVRRAIRAAGIVPMPEFWIACVFPGEGEGLPDGSGVDEVVEAMLGPLEGGAVPWGIGINCTKVQKVPGLVRKFEDGVRRMEGEGRLQEVPALVLYPDGTNGEVYNTTTKTWEKPEGYKDDGADAVSAHGESYAEESWLTRLIGALGSKTCECGKGSRGPRLLQVVPCRGMLQGQSCGYSEASRGVRQDAVVSRMHFRGTHVSFFLDPIVGLYRSARVVECSSLMPASIS